MFDNTKRSARAIKHIVISHRNHKRRMKMIKKNEQFMLDAIDNAFANIRAKQN